jgi:hypothetical protein
VKCSRYRGRHSTAPTTRNARPFQWRQPSRASTTTRKPARKRTLVGFTSMAPPLARPARAAISGRSKRLDSKTSQTVAATDPARGALSMYRWNRETIIGLPSATTAASAPARFP